MYYTFTIPREKFDETNIDRSMILRLISKHYSIRAPEILKNVGYYFGTTSRKSTSQTEISLLIQLLFT